MKKNIIYIILPVWFLGGKALAQIGAVNNSPDKTAILDLRMSSLGTAIDNKGLLIPQVSLVALTSISPIVVTPATSLLVYNTNAAIIGGKGYYYWENSKWNKLTNYGDLTGDNLGNHIASMNLNMSGFDIQQAGKTSTQTEAIALGTDGLAPQPGNVATAADTQGNIVWKPLPNIDANSGGAFVVNSTGANTTASLNTWVAVPGLYGYTYTAPKDGYLIVKANVFIAMNDLTTAGVNTTIFQSGLRFKTLVGGVPIADPRGTVISFGLVNGSSQKATSDSGKNPIALAIFTQFPVTAGTTYTFTLETADVYRYNNTAGSSLAGSFTDYGGTSLISSMTGILMAN